MIRYLFGFFSKKIRKILKVYLKWCARFQVKDEDRSYFASLLAVFTRLLSEVLFLNFNTQGLLLLLRLS